MEAQRKPRGINKPDPVNNRGKRVLIRINTRLNPIAEKSVEKYCLQLYHFVATGAETVKMEGKKVVEVGCGREGGALYIAKNLCQFCDAKEIILLNIGLA
jgi:hypothetical protein